MLELTPARKNRVNIADYNYQKDIENRMLLADSTPFELSVLEEILFSPLKISLKKLVRNMGCEEAPILLILRKLVKTGLLSIQEDQILIDKEMRKYFEFEIARFSADFKPDIEFLLGVLRKVPIHLLPSWFSIPRTSNNIFESIVEKYFLTPQIFQRYLHELHFSDPIVRSILSDLFSAPDFTLYSSDLIAKYNLTRQHFEEILLLFEFHFVGYLSYRKAGDHWIEVITPFYEWHQYLRFFEATEAPILKDNEVVKTGTGDFPFIESLSRLLSHLIHHPLTLKSWNQQDLWSIEAIGSSVSCLEPLLPKSSQSPELVQKTFTHLVKKLLLVKLAHFDGSKLAVTDLAKDWLEKNLEDRALYLYRHPMNQIISALPSDLLTERHIREAEKSIRRVIHGKWVKFDDFVKGVTVTLSERSVVSLKKVGKHYNYALPVYEEPEKNFLKATIFEWLFEIGMVAIGTHQTQKDDCFCVTAFGRFCFAD